MGRPSKFSEEFKREAVRLLEAGQSLEQVAVDLGVGHSSLSRWRRHYGMVIDAPTPADGDELREENARLRTRVRVLEEEREILKKANGLLREGKQMRFAFIDVEKANHAVETLCRVLQVSRSGFYAWQSRPESARAVRDRQLTAKIRVFHAQSRGRYGSPMLHRDLRDDGERVGRKRVARLMRQQNLAGRRKRRFRRTTNSEHKLAIAPNLLERRFDAAARDQVWAADITYVRTWEGWLYLAVVIDLYSRRVVGWSMANHLRTELPLTAMHQALLLRRPPAGLLHHSDRGCQYAAEAYQRLLANHGVIPSMSRKGNCWDNAVVESFFSTLKEELIYRGAWATRRGAELAIADYIENYYNRHRRHSSNGYVSPVKYENPGLELKRAA
ncbi:MAG: IS3 family transposase [Pseudomonadota bacterium]